MITFEICYASKENDYTYKDVVVNYDNCDANDPKLWYNAAVAAVENMPDGAQIIDTIALVECKG